MVNLKSKIWMGLFLVLFMAAAGFASTGLKVEPDLALALEKAGDQDMVRVVVLLNPRHDLDAMSELVTGLDKQTRRQILWELMEEASQESQENILTKLYQEEQLENATRIRPMVIANGVAIEAKPNVIYDLAVREDVYTIIHTPIKYLLPEHTENPTTSQLDDLDELAWGVNTIGAPAVWAEGFTGEDVLLAVIDTGVRYTHHDLEDHLWDGGLEYPNHGYDFFNDDNNPIDDHSHGTHCAGSALGDGTAGTQSGVAPDATLMCLKVLNSWGGGGWDATWLALDFVLEQGVDVTSISLGLNQEPTTTRRTFREHFDALNIAGIVSCVAGGNERGWYPPVDNIGTPGNTPSPWRNPDEVEVGARSGVITVGATHIGDGYASFSSEGPVTWASVTPWSDWPYGGGHVGLIKPDVSAPGENIKSLDYQSDTGYLDGWDGTSMATPHVAGLVALMLSKSDDLEPMEIDSLLQTTSLDLGPAGKDNDYGAGRVQAYEAVDAVITERGIISGIVSDANTGAPIQGAMVRFNGTGRYAVSDPFGAYMVEVPIRPLTMYVDQPPYEFYEETNILLEIDENRTIDISLNVGLFQIEPTELNLELEPGADGSINFDISNIGTALMDVRLQLSPDTTEFLWLDSLFEYNMTDVLGDGRLRGVKHIDGHFYISGSNDFDNPNKIYVVNENNELVNTLDQPGDDGIGMYDLAYDGSLIWGCVADSLIALNPEDGSQVKSFASPYYPTKALAFDPNQNVMWACESLRDVVSVDTATGEILQTWEFSELIQGMDWNADDPDGFNLYIGCKVNDDQRAIYRMNVETGEVDFLENLPDNSGDRDLTGFTLAKGYGMYYIAAVGLLNVNTGDVLKGYQIEKTVGWAELDANEFSLEAGNQQQMGLGIHTGTLPMDMYNVYLLASHNTLAEQTVIPLNLNVYSGADENVSTIPESFELSTPYPNPFNATTSVKFAMAQTGHVAVKVFDVLGREVVTLQNGQLEAGRYIMPLQMNDFASGVYFVRMEAGSFVSAKKVVLMK